VSEVGEPQILRRDIKVLTMKLLSALKEFYTFKELEEMLGLPYQVLWRYTNFLTTPEEGTARRILRLIREKRLIENALERNFEKINSISDIWEVVKNIGFLDLIAFEAMEALEGVEFDAVLAFPEESGVLGAVIAHWARSDVCVTSRLVSIGEALVEYYRDNSLSLGFLAISKSCLPRRGRVVLATLMLRDRELLEAAIALVKKNSSTPIALVAVFAYPGENWEEVLRNRGIARYRVFKYVNLPR
jgi:adenine phosphoribosyltransferase